MGRNPKYSIAQFLAAATPAGAAAAGFGPRAVRIVRDLAAEAALGSIYTGFEVDAAPAARRSSSRSKAAASAAKPEGGASWREAFRKLRQEASHLGLLAVEFDVFDDNARDLLVQAVRIADVLVIDGPVEICREAADALGGEAFGCTLIHPAGSANGWLVLANSDLPPLPRPLMAAGFLLERLKAPAVQVTKKTKASAADEGADAMTRYGIGNAMPLKSLKTPVARPSKEAANLAMPSTASQVARSVEVEKAQPLVRAEAEIEMLRERVRILEILLAEERGRAKLASEAAYRDFHEERLRAGHAMHVAHERSLRIEQLEHQASALQASLQAVFASTSWRITGPMRRLSLRSVLRKGH
jgi:hypothetical protein